MPEGVGSHSGVGSYWHPSLSNISHAATNGTGPGVLLSYISHAAGINSNPHFEGLFAG